MLGIAAIWHRLVKTQCPALQAGAVQFGQFKRNDLKRPAVNNQMRHGQNQTMTIRRQRQNPGSQHRPLIQLDWRQYGIVQPTPKGCRSEEHTSELQSLMRTSYAVFCLK